MINVREMAQLDQLDPQTRRAMEFVYEFAEWFERQSQYETEDGDMAFYHAAEGGPTWDDVERAFDAWNNLR